MNGHLCALTWFPFISVEPKRICCIKYVIALSRYHHYCSFYRTVSIYGCFGTGFAQVIIAAFCTVQFVSEQYFKFLSICEQHSSFSKWYVCFANRTVCFLNGTVLFLRETVRFVLKLWYYVSNSVIASILYITRQLTRKIEKITLYNGIIRNSQVYLLVWLIFDGGT